MKIQNWDKIFLNMAHELATGSKCVSFQVGCIVTKNRRIVSTGVNGSQAGALNCCDKFPEGITSDEIRQKHREWSIVNEVHAEMSAIINAAKEGISIKDTNFYITMSPCSNCLKNIISLGVINIFFSDFYDGTDNSEMLKVCDDKEVNLYKWIDHRFVRLTINNLKGIEDLSKC